MVKSNEVCLIQEHPWIPTKVIHLEASLSILRQSLQREIKQKSPLNAPFMILKWPCLIQEKKKTYTLKCFCEFSNRKKEQLHEKKEQVAIKFLIAVLLLGLFVMYVHENLNPIIITMIA